MVEIIKILKRSFKKSPYIYSFLTIIYFNFKNIKERCLSFLFRFFPIIKNKIVIINYHGKGYGDNGKYIAEEIIRNNKNYRIVWLINKDFELKSGLPKEINSVRYNSVRSIYELATAKIWINNCRNDFHVLKREGQFYIQTWHGGLGLKKIEADALDKLSPRYIRLAKRDSSLADLFISNSKHLSDIYKRAFWYSGKILESGYPKNDILFLEKDLFRNSVRNFFMLDSDKNILLYAPTFRADYNLSAYNIDFQALRNALNKNSNKDWVIMVRLHPNLDIKDFNSVFPKFVINATEYPDMQELVLGVDHLVTDYSSCMFDSALAEIPTFIYASDELDYMNDRGFYFSLDELPFSVSNNTQQLVDNVLCFNKRAFCLDLKNFYNKVGLYDEGNASIKVLHEIEKILHIES